MTGSRTNKEQSPFGLAKCCGFYIRSQAGLYNGLYENECRAVCLFRTQYNANGDSAK